MGPHVGAHARAGVAPPGVTPEPHSLRGGYRPPVEADRPRCTRPTLLDRTRKDADVRSGRDRSLDT